jgi:hypothetical protein
MTAALSACGSSAAATPCWKQVQSDWSNHRLGKTTYAASCYDQAITHLPPDVRYYSNAVDEIQAAKQAAINKKNPPRHTAGVGNGNSNSGGGGPTSGGSNGSPPGASPADTILGSSSADSVPLPLLIIAGLAILLLAAGAVGVANRHLQARQVTPDDPAA